MSPKKKKQNKISNRTKVFILIGLLVGVAFLFIFVTLPALDIHIFPTGGPARTTTTTAPRAPTTTTPQQPSTVPPAQPPVATEAEMQRAWALYDQSSNVQVSDSWFIPDVITFDDPEMVHALLLSKDTGIQEIRDILYLTYFINEQGQKTAWIRQTRNPVAIHEINLESHLPGYPQLHILDITPLGILLYYLNPDDPSGRQQQIYRVRAQPFQS